MKILRADFLITCKDDFEIIEDGVIFFDENIIDIKKYTEVEQKDYNIEYLGENSVILPGLVNPHVHLEFSANKTTLSYGDFITWLGSVIINREELIEKREIFIKKALNNILKSGTTAIGAISSFGGELKECVSSELKVVYFNEILGSRADTVDILFQDFKSRLHISEDMADEKFIPAISVHSPYSTHPILAKNALDIAIKKNYLISTHFMESQAERDWLDNGTGDFIKFFNSFTPNAKPLCSGLEYLDLFKDTKTLFTHCTKATKEEIDKIKSQNGYITHCPVSNRLLGNGRLKIEQLNENILTLGTDGLSSNISLNLWDEMRMALMLHDNEDINKLAKQLLKMATKNGAKSLMLNSSELKKDKKADIIVVSLPDKIISKDELATHLILNTKEAKKVFIDGKEIF